MGFPDGAVVKAAMAACAAASAAGKKNEAIRAALRSVSEDPRLFADDPLYGELARKLEEVRVRRAGAGSSGAAARRNGALDYACWGDEIDEAAHEQMRNACKLPVAVGAALMPDAHVGYGLPIGGVLATEEAVIPYAVGVDIACRMMMTVYDADAVRLGRDRDRFEQILNRETLFGVGGSWSKRREKRPEHPVMDEDWSVTPLTSHLKDTAWDQLGTSGSGNHFVEFGEFELLEARDDMPALEPGKKYIAVLSHSGSRGPGAQICAHYSKAARELHPELSRELSYLAWLPLSGEKGYLGQEYWAAMELMGKFASANHHVIHRKIERAMKSADATPVLRVENHHNFAWKERHFGRDVIVHRKGATPAGKGVLGLIPGSMAQAGYLVEGLGEPLSMDSASHGAGRRLSRTKARETARWSHLRALLGERGVHLISAGLDEAPHAYKDLEKVLEAQKELVRKTGKFTPRIVKMAPEGEKAED